MKKLIIKTELDIGKFLMNSHIDNIPLREVTKKDLENISKDDYKIIKIN